MSINYPRVALKAALTKLPFLSTLKRLLWNTPIGKIERLWYRSDLAILNDFALYAPSSGGKYSDRAKLTVQSASQVFPLLYHLAVLSGTERQIRNISAEGFCEDIESRAAAERIRGLFCKHGSDKSTVHNYHLVYGTLLHLLPPSAKILEVGLGTNNTDIVSSMGKAGSPGASLRAFRDFLPDAKIWGADIDRRVLFEEDRICTFFVDQTDMRSVEELAHLVPDELDVVIDDGLHSPNANIAMIIFAINKLRIGGWLVIEDINENSMPIWKVVPSLLPDGYEMIFIRTSMAYVFLAKKLSN